MQSSDLVIEASEEFSDYRDQFVSDEEFNHASAEYCRQAGLLAQGKDLVDHLREKLSETADKVDAGFPDNEYLRIEDGEPILVRPLERVECDDTKFDLMVIDPETRLPLGRPWLTTMIDVCTKMITGFYLSFHPPGYLSVMRCLLRAVRPNS